MFLYLEQELVRMETFLIFSLEDVEAMVDFAHLEDTGLMVDVLEIQEAVVQVDFLIQFLEDVQEEL